jgi:hypothetical protein
MNVSGLLFQRGTMSPKEEVPRSSFGVKRYLLKLNRDLDLLKSRICNPYDPFFEERARLPKSAREIFQIEAAVLFLEDRSFFVHRGFDWKSIARGTKRFALRGKLGGISTIDQQVVRIVLRRYERTLARKVNEVLLAIIINFHCSKRNIFTFYLNNAYLGYKMKGVDEASKKVFGKPAFLLNWEQSAFIASLLPLPFPKDYWEVYSTLHEYPFSKPESVIIAARDISPNWASRIEYRYRLGVHAQGFSARRR